MIERIANAQLTGTALSFMVSLRKVIFMEVTVRRIFLGFLMVFLDVNFTIDQHVIGLIPDFVGYILMVQGLDELRGESDYVPKARPFAFGMALYTGLLYLINLLGIVSVFDVIGYLFSLISMLCALYLTYLIVKAVREIEVRRGADLHAANLESAFHWQVFFQIAAYVLMFVFFLDVLLIIASLIMSCIFLGRFHTTKNLYEALSLD